jgi:aspartate aminotransferase
MQLSKIAQAIQISPIPVFAAEVDKRKKAGERLVNLTVGDFDPSIYPIAKELRDEIITAYKEGHTNYPGAVGVEQLRVEISRLLKDRAGIEYDPSNILIASGSRPLILAAYMALVDPGEKVLFPVPSWNNDYYTHLVGAEAILLHTEAKHGFMPTPEVIKPHIQEATLLSLCSPLNPTGTVMSADQTREICEMVVAENQRRGETQKPLRIMMDQVYWQLTYDGQVAVNPVSICPDIRDHIIFIDGLSKAYAATGLRVGWGFGPTPLIKKMRAIVAHMGAWAPKAEQVATGRYMAQHQVADANLDNFRARLHQSLARLYEGIMALQADGYPVDAINPQASIYLSVRLDLIGATKTDGSRLETADEVHKFILEEAKTAILPFSYFGSGEHQNWYRLSVGACSLTDIEYSLEQLKASLASLSFPTD